jgi:HK97 family phage major capsid protein
MTTRFDVPLEDRAAARVRKEAEAAGQSVTTYIRRRITTGFEPSDYRFGADGIGGASIVRDLRTVAGQSEGSSSEVDQAHERLRRFSRWVEDNPIPLGFTPQSTSTASQVVPPGYQDTGAFGLGADTPLLNACERRPISGSAGFTVPRAQGDGVVPASRTEGNNPSGSDPTYGSVSVSPAGVAGLVDVTRELLDSATGGGDTVMLQLLAEDLSRRVEERIYTELNGSNGQGGTITSGFVPSGAQARVSTTPATNLLTDLKKAVLAYANVRRRKARNIIAGTAALDPNLGGLLQSEANTGDSGSLANIFGANLNAAVNDFGTAAGDMRIAILGSGDVFAFLSPVQRFTYDEVAGPALARVAVWQYVGVAVARPRGLSSIRF